MKNRFRIIILFAFLFANLIVPAQDTILPNNKTESILPIFDSNDTKLNAWKSSREFKYIDYLDSLLRKQPLKSDTVRLNKKTGEILSGPSEKQENSFLGRLLNFEGVIVFFWLLALFFIGTIIYKVFIQSGFFSNSRKRKNTSSDGSQNEDLKTTHAYDQFIYDAEQKENYNEAVRYWFLKTLKNLKDLELILYSPDKTNQEYISELKGEGFQEQFTYLTRNYEYIWYGKFSLKKNLYHKIKNSFIAFNEQLIRTH